MSTVTIRPLQTHDELVEGVDLQRTTWGRNFDDIVSAALMGVSQKIGGVAAGAFGVDTSLIGIVFGLTGIRDNALVHWSHMLAVRPDWRGRGLGTAMKVYQRRRAMSLGINKMYWTFDPLEARNAHFNLNRLGAVIDDYVINMYGTGETSPLHRGIGTDRFVAEWRLDDSAVLERVEAVEALMSWDDDTMEATLASTDVRIPGIEPSPDLIRLATTQEGPLDRPQKNAPNALRFVEIPPDIQHMKSAHPDEASTWRTITRTSFMSYFSEGRTVAGFTRDPQSGRCFYVLDQPASDRTSKQGP